MKKGMYVRCPIDEFENPRTFICGRIKKVDEFSETVEVDFLDPFGFRGFYEEIPLKMIFNFENIKRCTTYRDAKVVYNEETYKVLSSEREDEWYYYYLYNDYKKEVIRIREDKIVISFLSGKVSPVEQLKEYEFQNPAWYLGRSIVSKTTKVLDNSVFGFKELAGCKIFLMPHQLKTIMRCLQDTTCRYMLADEVGMGKTVEAAAVLKVYLSHNYNKKVMIAVPRPLLAQWKTELFIKFEIATGLDQNDNEIFLITVDDINNKKNDNWDFVIIDEAHRILEHKTIYEQCHDLSVNTQNLLLLSATPVQQKKNEYLALLKLILPNKYDAISLDEFEELVKKQKSITKSTYLVLQDYDDFLDCLDDVDEEQSPIDNEECQDLFDDIVSGLRKINKLIDDETYKSIIDEIDIENSDYGKNKIQEALLYVCENYQLEKNIIRNRRRYMTDLPQRTLVELDYDLDPNINTFEYTTYDALVEWIVKQNLSVDEFCKNYIPVIMAMFSSSWAMKEQLNFLKENGLDIDENVEENVANWLKYENGIIDDLETVLSEPYNYSSRLVSVIDYIDQEFDSEKIVLFTNFDETFEKYASVLETYFGEERVALFNKRMTEDELEINIYRFQNEEECTILLCDETGGEGRNLQIADFVIHIDTPWDANAIEQRIGRLDRLGRSAEKDVCSVVVYSNNTLEEELFKFWNEGLNIFRHSLSGLEIIMGDINSSIIEAVTGDFRYGISNAIAEIIESSKLMEKEIREEQHFDTAAFIYASMNQELVRLLNYYMENENELFADTMMSWASLAGMNGSVNKGKETIRFNDSSFSIKSAENAQFIPPIWSEYINKDGNNFKRRIRSMYEDLNGVLPYDTNRDIVGTFKRDIAIENDYLHFFAPGDEVFDAIVDNAMKSYKGTCSAMVIESDFDWAGVVLNWELQPNEKLIYEKGIPITALRQYKNYISIDQITTAVPFQAYEHVNKEKVVRLIEKTAKSPESMKHDYVIHLGRRGKKRDSYGILNKYGCSNLDWFKATYSKEKWQRFINYAVKEAKEQASVKFSKGSNIKKAELDIMRTLNAEVAQAKFFDIDANSIEEKREMYDIVIKALKTSRFYVESAAFVIVRKIHG